MAGGPLAERIRAQVAQDVKGLGGIMRERDLERVRMAVEDGIRISASLGLDAGEIRMPV